MDTAAASTAANNEDTQPLLPHGTVRIYDEFRSDGVVLLPHPTSSPNDPLNWSLARKTLSASIVLFITALTAATSNSAGSAGDQLVNDYGITWDQVNAAAGVLFVGIGYGTLLLSSAPWLYGRRSSYLVCMLFGVIGNAWFAHVRNSGNQIGSQLFVGMSEAVAEATVQLSLMDLFFQHQRGLALGLYVLATSVGTFLGPLIAGVIADSSLGWQWIGWSGAIFSGATLLVTYFGLEETAFERSSIALASTTPGVEFGNGSILDAARQGNNNDEKPSSSAPSEIQADGVHKDKHSAKTDMKLVEDPIRSPKKTYWQRIAIVTPSPTLIGTGFIQYFTRMWNNITIMWLPAVVYAGIQWGFQDAWLTFYLTAEEDNWTSAPYNYSAMTSSMMNIPTLIGAVIGCVYGGAMSDWFVRQIAKRNNGVYEAEDRLWLMLLPAVLCPIGLIVFGIATYRVWPWQAAYVALGFIGFGWGCAGDLSMAYTMDAYPEMVLEGMVGVSVINNSLACIFTFVCSQWMSVNNIAEVFSTIGIVAFFIMLPLTLLMIMYGKRLRVWSTPRYEKFVARRG
ncbi:hypothetical protein ANO11243_003750 [Dothideomycetidae sp. 11243]|nr:hypothetical protein ANO11243_003750 [fungal sp. No.11243]